MNKNSTSKKKIETIYVEKFLSHFENLEIEKSFEKPDFILKQQNEIIGLEHQIIVNSKAREREGYLKNIFVLAQEELQNENPELLPFFATCYIHENFDHSLYRKNELKEIVKNVIRECIVNANTLENPIIYDIDWNPDDFFFIYPQLGAWWQKRISDEEILSSIRNKEEKLPSYRENVNGQIWLLLVINETGESSYIMRKEPISSFESKFDKIYVLEYIYNKIHQIK
ncbi:hypothetical protein [Flavobacterium sp.]|uniref:hypothetical protein n=1 Tax=Flavobacterium sp. TaxID=239 RepID=UPI0039E25E7C